MIDGVLLAMIATQIAASNRNSPIRGRHHPSTVSTSNDTPIARVSCEIDIPGPEGTDIAIKNSPVGMPKLTRLATRGKRTAESDAITLREGDRLLRDITTALDEVGTGEPTKEMAEAVAALRRALAHPHPLKSHGDPRLHLHMLDRFMVD